MRKRPDLVTVLTLLVVLGFLISVFGGDALAAVY